MRLHLESRKEPGVAGQGQGPRAAERSEGLEMQTLGDRGERVCDPDAFLKKESFIHSLVQTPVEHLIHANTEIKDLNMKTIDLTEGNRL